MFARKAKRKEVLKRYRRLRAISTEHAHQALKLASRKSYEKAGRRLGIVRGKKLLVFDSEQEMQLLADLTLCMKLSGPSLIERYRRSVHAPEGSEERTVLDAMCDWRFALLIVKHKHPVAGLVVDDLVRQEELWLMDESMEATAKPGLALASRLIKPAEFHTTTGAAVPMDELLLLEVLRTLPPQLRDPAVFTARSDKFVAMVYEKAIAMGTAERIEYA